MCKPHSGEKYNSEGLAPAMLSRFLLYSPLSNHLHTALNILPMPFHIGDASSHNEAFLLHGTITITCQTPTS